MTVSTGLQYITGLVLQDEKFLIIAGAQASSPSTYCVSYSSDCTGMAKLGFLICTVLSAVYTPYGSSTVLACAVPDVFVAAVLFWNARTQPASRSKGAKMQ